MKKEKNNRISGKGREKRQKGAEIQKSRLIPVLKALEGEHVILTVELGKGGQDGKEA